MKILLSLYAYLLSLLFMAPFFNQALLFVFGINFNFLYITLSIVSILCFLVSAHLRFPICSYSTISFFVLFLFFLLGMSPTLDSSFGGIIVGFIASIPLLFYKNVIYIFRKFSIFFILNSLIMMLLIVHDFNSAVTAAMNSSRTSFLSSPISISVAAGMAVLVTYYSSIPFKYKLFIYVAMAIMMLATLSRGPIFSLIFMIGLIALKERRFILATLGALFGTMGLLFISLKRGEALGQSDSARIDLYDSAIDLLSLNPLGGFNLTYFEMHTGYPFPHNFILDLWLSINIFFTLSIIFVYFSLFLKFILIPTKTKSRSELYGYFASSFSLLTYIFLVSQMSFPAVDILRIFLPALFLCTTTYFSFRLYFRENRSL